MDRHFFPRYLVTYCLSCPGETQHSRGRGRLVAEGTCHGMVYLLLLCVCPDAWYLSVKSDTFIK